MQDVQDIRESCNRVPYDRVIAFLRKPLDMYQKSNQYIISNRIHLQLRKRIITET